METSHFVLGIAVVTVLYYVLAVKIIRGSPHTLQ